MSRNADIIPLRRVQGDAAEMSDEALVAACAVGEPAALGALFDRHNRAVFRVLSRVAGGPAADLEDLVQSTFLEVWKSAARFHERSAARSWIFGIAANLARHYVRGEVRRRQAMRGLAEVRAASPRRPDDDVARGQLVARLGHALAGLPHDLRVAFVLCDLEGLSGVDAARTLGVRQGTMWRRLHDARKRLRDELDGRSS